MRIRRGDCFYAFTLALAALLLLSGCMKSPEEKYAEYMKSGASYLDQGDKPAAIIQFRNAARVKPNEAEPQYQLAKALFERGEMQGAYQAADQAVRLNPDHVEASLLLARILVSSGRADDLNEAEDVVDHVLSSKPKDSEALFILAATRARLGSSEDAEKLLLDALESSPDHLKAAIGLARLRLSKGDKEGAEKVLIDAVENATDKAQAKLALAQFYIGQNRIEDATKQIDEILKSDANNGAALVAKGILQLRAGDADAAEETYKKVSSLDNPAYKPLYGQVLFLRGKNAEAVSEFKKIYDENHDDRNARSRLIAAYVRNGQIDDAEALLSSIISDDPNDAEARLQRGELYLNSRRPTQAGTDVRAALELRSASAPAHFLMSKVYAAENNTDRQKQELDESMRLDRDFLPARLEMAQVLLKNPDSQRAALDVLDEAPDALKKDPRLLSARTWALIALKDYQRAGESLAASRAAVGETPEFLLQQGVMLAGSGRIADAKAPLEKALESRPGDIRALNALASTYVAEKQIPEALRLVKEQADEHASSAELQLTAAKWLARGGTNYVDDARRYFERAQAAGDPNNEASFALAQMDIASGNRDKALQRVDAILVKDSSNAGALLLKATALESAERFTESDAAYRALLEVQPRNAVALNNLAYSLATRTGNLDEALRYAQQAKEIAGSSETAAGAMVDDTLGWVYYLRQQYPTALLHLKTAAGKSPNSAVIHYHLAMAHARNSEPEAAREAYDAAVKLDGSLPEAKEAKKVLGL